jgi:excisionase family DNA binding protein
MAGLEKQYRLDEAAQLTGYSVHSLRRKIVKREVGFRKTGRIITIPESEVARLLGGYRPPIEAEKTA